jgi:ATP-dependent Clp protease ATP-binding subunit ClpX
MAHVEAEYCCSFCGKRAAEVRQLFAGNGGAFICDGCVLLSSKILGEEQMQPQPRRLKPRTPRPWWRHWDH